MAKLGTQERPIIAHVQSGATALYVAKTCAEHGWLCVISYEPNKPEDLSSLDQALNQTTEQPTVFLA